MNNNDVEDVKSMLHKVHADSIAEGKAIASGYQRHCNDERSAEDRIKDVIESLDNRMATLEKGVNCLNLNRDLLIDWTYHNTVICKDDQPKYPPEIDIAIQLSNLVISDLELCHDLIVEEQKELNRIITMIQ